LSSALLERERVDIQIGLSYVPSVAEPTTLDRSYAEVTCSCGARSLFAIEDKAGLCGYICPYNVTNRFGGIITIGYRCDRID
jgi:hypothetical protein